MRLWLQPALLALCSMGLGSNAMANLTFDGTLVEPPPCTINSGGLIETDFMDVGISKVDGINYRRPVSYTITCSSGTLPWEMVLTVKGSPRLSNHPPCKPASLIWAFNSCKTARP